MENTPSPNYYLANFFLIFISIYALNYLTIDIYHWYSAGPFTLFFDRTDIHADAIKAALSLKGIVGEAVSLPTFDSWPDSFKNYSGSYVDYSGAGTPGTIYHHPPLTFFYFEMIAFAIKWGFSPISILIFITSCAILIFIIITYRIRILFSLTNLEVGYLIITGLFSYPFIFALNRSNFPAIFSFLLLYYWVFIGINSKKFISLAISLNIRPNNIIAVLPFLKFSKNNILHVILLIFQFLFITLIFLYTSNYLNDKYTLESFISSLGEYKKAYLFMGPGDAYNSSLHSLARFFSISFGIEYFVTYLSYLAIYFWFILNLYLNVNINNTVKSFIGASCCMLLTPVFTDYHLLIFLIPLTFSVIEYKLNYKLSKIVGITAIFLLSPKLNFFIITISKSHL
jgi:hypothetical protein